jgi:ligand-binding sensor domain-containing protein
LVQSSAFRILSAAITLLLIAALAALILLTLRSQPTVTLQPAPTASPTRTPTVTATPFQTLGADLIVPEGGYRFQPLLGYAVTMQGAAVALTQALSATVPSDAEAASRATIGLEARPRDALGIRPGQPLEAALLQIAQPFIDETQAQAGAVEMLTVGGVDAVAVEVTGELDGAPIGGRIVVAQPDADRLFVAAGTAPLSTWEQTTATALAHILASVAFFEPAPIVAAATATPTATPRPQPTDPQASDATPAPTVPSVTIIAPTATRAITLTATPVITITTLLAPSPTPSPTARATAQPWSLITDANWMHELVVAGNTIWVATDGGALAWTRGSATPVKFTTLNGLTSNRLTAVADCALPDLGVIFGSAAGLQVVDPAAGGWRQLTSANSELSYDDVVDLACDPAAGYLVVGYAQHGIDIYDEARDEWRHLDRNSGLAFNRVQSLAVVGELDEIWVVGEEGVTVAAGADSTFYTADNSPLESNRIGAIVADADGVIWLGGDGALYRVAGESWTVYNTEEVDDAGFPVRLITGLALADDGALWLGDIDGAVCRFDPTTRTCTAAFRGEAGMASAPLTSLTLDADGQVYFTTAGDGFSSYDGADWERFARPVAGIRGNAVRAATVDADGALWVVTEAGVQRVVAPNRPPVPTPDSPIPPASIQAIYAGDNGDIWIGGAGAARWDGRAWTTYTLTDGLAGAVVQTLAADSRGRIWLGTDAGVSIWNGESFFNLTRDTGLPSADIRTLLADGEAMWIGSAGGGLYRFERNQLEVLNIDNMNLPSDTVTALALTDAGGLLVGTDAGLAELSAGVATPVSEVGERTVTQILARDDSLWVGTAADGLFYDVGDGWQQATTDGVLPSNRVTALAAVEDAIWVGGATGGLARYVLSIEEES